MPGVRYSVLWLAAGQLACAVIALVLWLIGSAVYRAREHGEVNAWEAVPLE